MSEGIEITGRAEASRVQALEELVFRCSLAVSLFFILLMVAGLYLKIRQVESAGEDRP